MLLTMDGSTESGWTKSGGNSNKTSFLVGSSHENGLVSRLKDRVDHAKNQVGFHEACLDEVEACATEHGNVNLRQWLGNPERPVNSFECLHIFRQIVYTVNLAHSQGIVLHNLRPSRFLVSSFNHVSFIETTHRLSLGSHYMERNNPSVEIDGSVFSIDQRESMFKSVDTSPVETQIRDKQPILMKQVLAVEGNWYTSPEEAVSAPSSCSDIYRLGVLLFELFSTFRSIDEKNKAMSSMRYRVLPHQLFLQWPKEASFCLWLLHPEPSSRPTIGELLESDFLNEPTENLGMHEASMELQEKLMQQNLLMEFLLLIRQRKRESADKLQETISFLSCDIDEVMKRKASILKLRGSFLEPSNENSSERVASSINIGNDFSMLGSGKRFRYQQPLIHNVDELDCLIDDGQTEIQESSVSKNSRLLKNFKKLELAYLSTRCFPVKTKGKTVSKHNPVNYTDGGSVVTEGSPINNMISTVKPTVSRQSGWINPFLDGMCKYFSFCKLKVKADLKQGDLLNSSNLVCSLSFDRDGEFFASAGVNKKIKIFEYNAILNEDRDIHYPVVEMSSKSKLSSTCWNSYIKSQFASSNFEGVVQIWDVTRSQVFAEMKEHEKRVWSIDFSSADPTLLASGSDDRSVKLWSINQGSSVNTIKTKANVCSVQFPIDSGRFLLFGSADHKIYYYDLRNSKLPLCTLIGHNKTVSYVKFVDSTSLVSSSTDSTLKLWDLSMCTCSVLESPVQSFNDHVNVKNFVGLSVKDGYIATGSETNEVFIYHKALPMPMMSTKFNSRDPFSGRETDVSSQFVSSVCWRVQSNTLVAANSTGNIKILEMV